MKLSVKTSILALTLAGSVLSGVVSIKACGLLFGDEQNESLGLDIFSVEGFISGIKAVNKFYEQNPEGFAHLLVLYNQRPALPMPADVLLLLKQFKLVDENTQIKDVVKLALDWAVEQQDDGTIKIWTFNDLLKDGWISVVVKTA